MGIISKLVLKTCETGLVPERLVRLWIKHQMQNALTRASLGDVEARHAVFKQVLKELRAGTNLCEINPREGEVEPGEDFFKLFLGKRLNLGCSYFPTGAEDLDEAEDTMLWMTADRAKIRDGMSVLELGGGWGAMGFWLAEQYPSCQITSLIENPSRLIALKKRVNELGLKNLQFISAELEELDYKNAFDRVLCLERLELVVACKGWELKIKEMLKENGKFFLQSAVHAQYAYYQASVGLKNSMAKYVYSPVMVPAADLLLVVQSSFSIEEYYKISGEAYRLTAEKWLKRFYFNRMAVFAKLEKVYGKKGAWVWMQRWKLYFLNCIVQYGYNRGQEWIVAQYLMTK
jgi:cyclopropane-fatty-acyl-phospholipid synthase